MTSHLLRRHSATHAMSADDDQYPRVPPPEVVNAAAEWLSKMYTMTPDSELLDPWDALARAIAQTTRRLWKSKMQKHKDRDEHGAAQVKRGTEERPIPPAPHGTHWMLVRTAARKNPPPSNNKRKRSRPQKNDVPLQKPAVAKMRVSSSSSSSGLLDLADASESLEEDSREKGVEEEEEKFVDFEIDHLVWARTNKTNWMPAQITAISHSLGGRRTTSDVEFFLKDKNGYTRAENLPITNLEAVTEYTFNRRSPRKPKTDVKWVNAIMELREAYNASCAEGQRLK